MAYDATTLAPSASDAPSSTSSGLLAKARTRDPQAWRQLVDLYTPLLYDWCRQSKLGSEDAADVVQEVLGTVTQSLDRFRGAQPRGSFRAWLRQILRSRIADHFRNQRRQSLDAQPLEPEQVAAWADLCATFASDEPADAPDVADIYSLGCTLYKLLTGHAPFSGPEYRGGIEKMMAHVQKTIRPVEELRPEVPAELAAVIHCMLAKPVDERFATPAELIRPLAPFCAGADLASLLFSVMGETYTPVQPTQSQA